MSDLLAPILLVTQDEVDAFWLFEALMRRVGGNFLLWSGIDTAAPAAGNPEKTCCQLQLDGAPPPACPLFNCGLSLCVFQNMLQKSAHRHRHTQQKNVFRINRLL